MSANIRACTREEVERTHGPALTVLAHQLVNSLPGMGQHLATQMAKLSRDPSPERCELMVVELASVQTHVRQLLAEVLRGDQPTV